MASGPNCAATSTITSPTRCTPSPMPSAARLSTATWLGQSAVRQHVGDHPVHLLGHRAVERAQARLDVADRKAGLRRHQRARQRRVGVAVDQHHAGLLGGQHRFQPHQHRPRLLGVAARAGVDAVVGRRQPELLEEHPRQSVVVVLAGVHQHVVADLRQRPRQWCRLDELWPVADDREDLHAGRLPGQARGEVGQAAARQQHPGHDQHRTRHPRDRVPVVAQAAGGGQHAGQPDAGDDEGHAQAEP